MKATSSLLPTEQADATPQPLGREDLAAVVAVVGWLVVLWALYQAIGATCLAWVLDPQRGILDLEAAEAALVPLTAGLVLLGVSGSITPSA